MRSSRRPLLGFEAPPTSAAAEATFFLEDAEKRIGRASEIAWAYLTFLVLLYIRLLCTAGEEVWDWLREPWTWLLVMLPLFVLDFRGLHFALYLRRHQATLQPHDFLRFAVLALGECVYKVGLCIYLACPHIRHTFPAKAAAIPFGVGYVVHFIVGHFTPVAVDEEMRAEGCNTVSSLLSELLRFFQFMLVVSVSLKVDDSNEAMYNWQLALWPCWGLEVAAVIAVMLLLPVLMVSALRRRPMTFAISWITTTCLGLAVGCGFSLVNLSELLDTDLRYCPGEQPFRYLQCRSRLNRTVVPWFGLLPIWAFITGCAKGRLANSMHNYLFQASGAARTRRLEHVEVLPAPQLMFMVTPTYYSRSPPFDELTGELLTADGDMLAPLSAMASASVASHSHVVSHPVSHHVSHHNSAAPSARGSTIGATCASVTSGVSRPHDAFASIMSARGAAYSQIVESEHLCWLCYDAYPDSVLLECGHAGVCSGCAKRLINQSARCPICRKLLSQAVLLRSDLPIPQALFLRPRSGTTASPSAPPEPATGGQPSFNANGGTSLTQGEAWEWGGESLSSCPDAVRALPFSWGPPWPAAAKKYAVVTEQLCKREPG